MIFNSIQLNIYIEESIDIFSKMRSCNISYIITIYVIQVLSFISSIKIPNNVSQSNPPPTFHYDLNLSWSGGKLVGVYPHVLIQQNNDNKNRAVQNPKKYPLYLWVTGTKCIQETYSDYANLQAMAKRGYVAVQVIYDNHGYPQTCDEFLKKAAPIFDKNIPNSATKLLCDISDNSSKSPPIDCSLGVACHGFSQGSQLTSRQINRGEQKIDFTLN